MTDRMTDGDPLPDSAMDTGSDEGEPGGTTDATPLTDDERAILGRLQHPADSGGSAGAGGSAASSDSGGSAASSGSGGSGSGAGGSAASGGSGGSGGAGRPPEESAEAGAAAEDDAPLAAYAPADGGHQPGGDQPGGHPDPLDPVFREPTP